MLRQTRQYLQETWYSLVLRWCPFLAAMVSFVFFFAALEIWCILSEYETISSEAVECCRFQCRITETPAEMIGAQTALHDRPFVAGKPRMFGYFRAEQTNILCLKNSQCFVDLSVRIDIGSHQSWSGHREDISIFADVCSTMTTGELLVTAKPRQNEAYWKRKREKDCFDPLRNRTDISEWWSETRGSSVRFGFRMGCWSTANQRIDLKWRATSHHRSLASCYLARLWSRPLCKHRHTDAQPSRGKESETTDTCANVDGRDAVESDEQVPDLEETECGRLFEGRKRSGLLFVSCEWVDEVDEVVRRRLMKFINTWPQPVAPSSLSSLYRWLRRFSRWRKMSFCKTKLIVWMKFWLIIGSGGRLKCISGRILTLARRIPLRSRFIVEGLSMMNRWRPMIFNCKELSLVSSKYETISAVVPYFGSLFNNDEQASITPNRRCSCLASLIIRLVRLLKTCQGTIWFGMRIMFANSTICNRQRRSSDKRETPLNSWKFSTFM